ncbi:MAG TPA: hypothetical protein VIW94_11575 [Acidimicrobiia bacterium]
MKSSVISLAVLGMLLTACGTPAEPTNAEIASETELTEHWPCGIGFAASNSEQTVALFVYSNDSEPNPPVSFPDPAWDARLVLGQDLLANHCDDVIEPGEPEPVIEEEWTINGGILDFEDPGTGLCGAPGPVTGSFTGLAGENNASTVEIGDLEVVNISYGCFAG